MTPPVAFPRAHYFIATSRLLPGVDGGYTVASMQRAKAMAEFGGLVPQILTFDLRIDYPALRQEFIVLGLATEHTVMRNLYAELRESPELLRGSALLVPAMPGDDGPLVAGEPDLDAAGVPWRTAVAGPDGTIRYTEFTDVAGRPLFRLPFISGRADWHRAEVLIDVLGDDGSVIGALRGFAGLYRAWLNAIVAEAPEPETVVICEARQVGELLAGDPNRRYRLLHTVHSSHTLVPHDWDSPMDAFWTGWTEHLDEFDGVLWLTEAQRADVARRFGAGRAWGVVPHPAEADPVLPPLEQRDPLRAVMVARLAPVKRIDHAIRAWQHVVSVHPGARLDVFGDGPLRAPLQELIDELGLSASVILRGHSRTVAAELRTASVLLFTSEFEGQGMVICEAFGVGTPAISYDIRYGPTEIIEDGVSGTLVPDGDIAALGSAVAALLGDPARIESYSRAAHQWAIDNGPEQAMQRTAALISAVLDDSVLDDSVPDDSVPGGTEA